MNQDTLLFGTALLAGSFFLINNSMKNKREGFRADPPVTGGRNGGAQAVMSNPGNFPSTPSMRDNHYGTLNGGLTTTAPGQLSAAGPSFVNSGDYPKSGSFLDANGSPIEYKTPDFKSVGSYTQDTLLRNNNLTSEQVTQALRDVYGGKTPDLQSARDLLPIPDMKYTSSIDPTNPENFIYNRTLFARLKRRYGNGVDFIRGDIDVKPEYRGWFDIRPPADNDLVQGYFDKYIDIEQETHLQDSIFTRNTPISDIAEGKVNPWGKQYLLEGVANQTSSRFGGE